MTNETITLISLEDAAEANIIKNKLETEGIICFINNKRGPVPVKVIDRRSIDIKVYFKDLDHALKMIDDDYRDQ